MKPLVAFDWDGKAVWATWDGKTVEEVKNRAGKPAMLVLLARLAEPHLAVTEASFESYDPDQRERIILAYEREGHQLRTLSQRLTAWWRIERGLDKSNEQDALAIYDLAASGKQHLKLPALVVSPEWLDRREEAEHELMVLRRSGRKDAYAQRVIKLLPPADRLDERHRFFLCGKSGYSGAIVAASAVAVKHTANRREWERLLGLSASGKNSQFRSDIYHHGLKPKLVREAVYDGGGNPVLTKAGKQKYRIVTPTRLPGDLTMTDWRRALRWLHHQLRDALHPDGTPRPEMGTANPRGGA